MWSPELEVLVYVRNRHEISLRYDHSDIQRGLQRELLKAVLRVPQGHARTGVVADDQASMNVEVRSSGTVELRTALYRRCHGAYRRGL